MSPKLRLVHAASAAIVLVALASAPSSAQRAVQMSGQGNFQSPVAPKLAVPPLPTEPVDIVTAEQNIRVSVIATGLDEPWSMTFPSPDVVLIAERDGAIRIVRGGKLEPEPVQGGPAVARQGLSGFDLALHPNFAENHYIYYAYPKDIGPAPAGAAPPPAPPGAAGQPPGPPPTRKAIALGRAKWDGAKLTDAEDLWTSDPDGVGGSRIAFGKDGTVYVSMTGANAAQDPTSLHGKVLRLTDEGKIPPDNPFVGKEGYRPEIYTTGHRTVIGLAMHPDTGEMWATENGPNGGDELNRLVPGGNYGWPEVSLGRDYSGPWQGDFERDGVERPVAYWTPAIAVSGLAFYRGDKLPGWKGDVIVGSMRYGEITGTGHFQRIVFNEKMDEMRREVLLWDWRQRIRDVRQGADGALYLLTDGEDAALLKVEAAP